MDWNLSGFILGWNDKVRKYNALIPKTKQLCADILKTNALICKASTLICSLIALICKLNDLICKINALLIMP